MEGRDPVEDYHRINAELKKYSEKLAQRRQILVANKIDLPTSAEHLPRLRELAQKEGLDFFAVSAATGEGTAALVDFVGNVLPTLAAEMPENEEKPKIYDADEETEQVTITRNDAGDFIVAGKNLEKLVAMTNFGNDEALRRFQYIWRLKGIDEQLKARGIKEGTPVHIGDMEFEWHE